ncbi:unnamed protein product [Ixodes pacificus]
MNSSTIIIIYQTIFFKLFWEDSFTNGSVHSQSFCIKLRLFDTGLIPRSKPHPYSPLVQPRKKKKLESPAVQSCGSCFRWIRVKSAFQTSQIAVNCNCTSSFFSPSHGAIAKERYGSICIL